MTHSNSTSFVNRHIGLSDADIAKMLGELGYDSLDQLTETVVPNGIADNSPLALASPISEEQALAELYDICLLYTSPSPRDQRGSRMPSSA